MARYPVIRVKTKRRILAGFKMMKHMPLFYRYGSIIKLMGRRSPSLFISPRKSYPEGSFFSAGHFAERKLETSLDHNLNRCSSSKTMRADSICSYHSIKKKEGAQTILSIDINTD